ncbi:YdeI/OmpD-associated family protein [Undibacterium sp. Di27W]|uniref:YdeI/OmpD-associated family protein n=1 Tax=Undibacterium sp. Di27W TaxID=3413036 RepID=UPI003BF06E64
MNSKVDGYVARAKQWQEEIAELRKIALDCELTEELKWGTPCYTSQGSNIVLIHVFKEYAALLFFKGALLKDPKNILIQQTENTQAARQLRFTSAQEIVKMKATIKAYIAEAIKVEKAGLKVDFKKTEEFSMPEEFQQKLEQHADLKTAFEALTPGRQRAYLLHFSAAKQAKTREARVEKCMQKILEGKGLDDE